MSHFESSRETIHGLTSLRGAEGNGSHVCRVGKSEKMIDTERLIEHPN